MEGKVFIYQEDRRHYSLELGPWICLRKSPSAPWDRNSGRCSGGHGQSHRTDPGTSFFPAPRCGSTSSCRTCLKPVCRTRRVRTGTKRSCPSEHEPPPRGNDAESRAAGPPPRRHRPRASPPSAEKRPPAVPFALSLCPRVHMVIPGQLRSRLLRAVGTQMARDTLAVSSPGWTSRLPTEAAPPRPAQCSAGGAGRAPRALTGGRPVLGSARSQGPGDGRPAKGGTWASAAGGGGLPSGRAAEGQAPRCSGGRPGPSWWWRPGHGRARARHTLRLRRPPPGSAEKALRLALGVPAVGGSGHRRPRRHGLGTPTPGGQVVRQLWAPPAARSVLVGLRPLRGPGHETRRPGHESPAQAGAETGAAVWARKESSPGTVQMKRDRGRGVQ